MARISLSPLIVDVRNKQADTVFSKWKGINYIRSRVVPSNPRTSAQMAIRNALTRLVALFKAAQPTLKLNLDAWARGKDLSGFNRFIGKNVVDEKNNALIDLTEDLGYDKLTTWTASSTATAGEIQITFAPSPVPTGKRIHVHIREQGSSTWAKKEDIVSGTSSPVTYSGFTSGKVHQVYGYLYLFGTTKGEEVGDDSKDTVTPT